MIRFAILLLILWASSTNAASFDCANARTNMENAICNDVELSQLDEKLSTEYKKSRTKLSSTSEQQLIASQRSWLKFFSIYCFVDINAAPVSKADATICLVRAFKDRINDLVETGESIGGFNTFTAIDHNIRVLKDSQSIYVLERKFIQVNETNPFANALNRYLKFKEKTDLQDERGIESYDIKLSKISPDWLYKQTLSEIFTGAYPTSSSDCGLYSIEQGRAIKISDIFLSNAWLHVFESVTREHFSELAKKEKDFDMSMVSDFRPGITQPSSLFPYCLNKKGIELYGFLPHVVRAFDGVIIEWPLLNKLLTPYALEQVKKMGGS